MVLISEMASLVQDAREISAHHSFEKLNRTQLFTGDCTYVECMVSRIAASD